MTKPASPTGLPVLPPRMTPYVAFIVAAALAAQQAEAFPPGSIGAKAVGWVVALGVLFGLCSAGLRTGSKAALVMLALGLAVASPARAEGFPWGVTAQAGPSVPLLVYQPGAEQALQLGAGAGVQVTFSHPAFERDFGGQRWTLLSVPVMAFGRVVSPASRADFAELSVAGGLCTMSGLFCVVAGHPLLSLGPARPGWFLGLAGGFNFEVGPEVAFNGGPLRANTVRLHW